MTRPSAALVVVPRTDGSRGPACRRGDLGGSTLRRYRGTRPRGGRLQQDDLFAEPLESSSSDLVNPGYRSRRSVRLGPRFSTDAPGSSVRGARGLAAWDWLVAPTLLRLHAHCWSSSARRSCFRRRDRAGFMREAAQSHRGLFPERADAYGENVRAKLERCLKVTHGRVRRGVVPLEEYRITATKAMEGVDLLITPTLAFAAPPAPGTTSKSATR